MKKTVVTLAALLALGLVACSPENTTSSSTPEESPTETTTPTEDGYTAVTINNKAELQAKWDIESAQTRTLSISTTPAGNVFSLVQTGKLKITVADPTILSVNGLNITPLKKGTTTLTVTLTNDDKTTVEDDVSITITEREYVTPTPIAQAKSQVGKMVAIRGEVRALDGSDAYVVDETGGMFVYNWAGKSTDTALDEEGNFTLGMDIEVYGELKQYNGLLELCSGGEAYAVKSREEVTPMEPISLDETGYKALKSTDSGNIYKFTAEYVETEEDGDESNVIFKLGAEEVTLRTSKYDLEDVNTVFAPGDDYDIVAPLTWYNNPQFDYFSQGVTISRVGGEIVLESIELTASKANAKVGDIVSLNYKMLPTGAVGKLTYEFTEGEDLCTVDGNDLIITGAGTIKVKAISGGISSPEVTITATELADSTTAVAKTLAKNDAVRVKGKVTAIDGKAAYITDKTGGIYVYNFAPADGWTMGAEVIVTGNIDIYNGLYQVKNGSDLCKIETTTGINPKAATTIDEAGFKALTAADAGNTYTFVAEYVKGDVNTTDKHGKRTASSVTFRMGKTEFVLRTSKYDDEIDVTLTAGKYYTITTPLSWYNGAQFAFLSQGTTVTEYTDLQAATGIEIVASADSVDVDQTITFESYLTPFPSTGTVTYSIVEGSEFAKIEGNELTGVQVGQVQVQGSIGEVKSNIVTITVTMDKMVLDFSDEKINTLGEYATEISATKVNITVGGVNFLWEKNTSSDDIRVSGNKLQDDPIRIYSGQKITLTAPTGYNITGVVLEAGTGDNAFQADKIKEITEGVTAVAGESTGFQFASPMNSFYFVTTGKQIRVSTITINLAKAAA